MSKKTFMAAIIISAFLVTTVAGMQVVEVTQADFVPIPTTPPSVVIINPLNSTTQPKNTLVEFNVTVPDAWLRVIFGYSLDDQPLIEIQRSTLSRTSVDHWKFTLQNLSDGPHTLKVSVKIGKTESTDYDRTWHFVGVEGVSSPVNFKVDTIPLTISILSPLNDSFFNVSIEGVSYQLIYETNSTLSWVGYSIGGNGYSIDGKGSGNLTVSENGTRVRDFGSSGYHTLTLYANDTSGNWAIPQTVTYLVNFYPEYTPAPSPSPTQQPTTEHSQTLNNAQENFTSTAIIIGLVIAVIVTVGVLVYFKKTKK
jgi:hypothetical protein